MLNRMFKGDPARLRVLMVCMGNICRSPMAEGVLRARLATRGLDRQVKVDSAGTHGYHRGNPPDPRAVAQAGARGYAIGNLRARAVADADFERFDLLLAMDHDNLHLLHERCPPQFADRIGLLLSHASGLATDEVPDPYYGSAAAFDHALDLIEAGCDGLMPLLLGRLHGKP